WQMGKVGEYQQVLREKVLSPDEAYKKINNELSILFAFQYFGDPLLKKKVGSIKLSGWIRAYQLLVDECEKFLKKRKEVSVFNVDNYCFSKPINKWEKYFQQAGFTKEESKEIIKIFTFDHTSQDLIDCPFIRVDENLILIPSLTSKADIS